MKAHQHSLVAGLLVTTVLTTVSAADINVPGDEPTIQAAINAAVDGEHIVVAPGIRHERIDFMGKAITVRSTDPTDPEVVAATIVDGTGLGGSVVTCQNAEGPDTVLSGFVPEPRPPGRSQRRRPGRDRRLPRAARSLERLPVDRRHQLSHRCQPGV